MTSFQRLPTSEGLIFTPSDSHPGCWAVAAKRTDPPMTAADAVVPRAAEGFASAADGLLRATCRGCMSLATNPSAFVWRPGRMGQFGEDERAE